MKAAAASTNNGAAMDVERAILLQFFAPNFDQRFGHFDGCGGRQDVESNAHLKPCCNSFRKENE